MKPRANLLTAVTGGVAVRISAASMRQKFISCGPVCIANGCRAKCCDAPTHHDGIRVYVHPSEQELLVKKHGKHHNLLNGDFLKPTPLRLCPFKTTDHLCALFNKPERPFGCIASPFMLNKNNTLVIRNRYRLLPCYDRDNGDFAYRVFQESIHSIFGIEAPRLINHLERGGGDFVTTIKKDVYEKLSHREEAFASER